MDIAAHVLYGVAACSQTGWAGGRNRASAARWYRDPTVWVAASFSVLPDAVSMGLPLLLHLYTGDGGNFFMRFSGSDLMVYRYMHSLLVALAVVAAVGLWQKRWMIPTLAWPLHVAMDSFSHSDGKFKTTLLYPISDWGIDGVAWWMSGAFVAAYWIVLLMLWFGLYRWRAAGQRGAARSSDGF